jgi:hypothetical protein
LITLKDIEQIEQDYHALLCRAKEIRSFTWICPNCAKERIIDQKVPYDLTCECGETWVIGEDYVVRNLNTSTDEKPMKWTREYYCSKRPWFII